MVVRPDEIIKAYDTEKLEKQIDDALKQRWKGENTVEVSFSYDTPADVLKGLANKYRHVGWEVGYESYAATGIRDESCKMLKFSYFGKRGS